MEGFYADRVRDRIGPRRGRGGRSGGRIGRDLHELHDALELERALLAAEVTVGDEEQLAVAAADVQRLDHPLRAALAGVEVLHHHRLALLERLFQLQREQALARVHREQTHRPTLLADRVAQARGPPPYCVHQALVHQRRR